MRAALPAVAVLSLLLGCAGPTAPTVAADPVGQAPGATAPPALQAGSVSDLLPPRLAGEQVSPEELDLRRAVLGALGTCPPQPAAVAAPTGLVLPPGAVVTRVRVQPDSVQVDGWVPLTPVAMREHYLADPDVVVVASEDEVLESETQLEAGGHDVFVKARAVCPTVSTFLGVVTPDTGKADRPAAR